MIPFSFWWSGIPTTGMLWAWIDFSFRGAWSGVNGTRLGGAQKTLDKQSSQYYFALGLE
jgi:hypothetical protein